MDDADGEGFAAKADDGGGRIGGGWTLSAKPTATATAEAM